MGFTWPDAEMVVKEEAVGWREALPEGPEKCVEEPPTREDDWWPLPVRLDDASL